MATAVLGTAHRQAFQTVNLAASVTVVRGEDLKIFQAVRRWWGSGRSKVIARLFAFEFVVVMAGVLAAQALANSVQHRADLGRMEVERARVRYELETAYSINQAWNRAVPCLNERLTAVDGRKAVVGRRPPPPIDAVAQLFATRRAVS